ncbi:MAG: TIGR04552 family protein [Myxococcota bacterium]
MFLERPAESLASSQGGTPIPPQTPVAEPVATPRGLADLAAIRTVLTGEAAVDLAQLWFTDRASVDDFLRLNAFDTDNPLDLSRLRDLHHNATVYLADTHRYRLPRPIERPAEIHDLFLAAAEGSRRLRRFACMTLKVMHILHHIACKELVSGTPISEVDLLERLNKKVFSTIDEMRAAGIAVNEFATGKKTQTSLVTKLLAKPDALATHIFDRLRFRIVLGTRQDVVLALIYLVRHLLPFNYVVSRQSQNGLISLGRCHARLGTRTQRGAIALASRSAEGRGARSNTT